MDAARCDVIDSGVDGDHVASNSRSSSVARVDFAGMARRRRRQSETQGL